MIFVTVIVTTILVKNTDDVNFWLFGDTRISKVAMLGFMFLIGLITGGIVFKRKKPEKIQEPELPETDVTPTKHYLSDEDRDYIS
ncbi:hypothetical protein GS399_16215 [Pedobacter sp. HMF7647]|uniref:Uncharacterized protein n=1 Tax=Hufsiella arboris TaxID=2695275 RepID=A0A7K1YDU0_9SPHI|nr:hypothetical protein [Hufsiella arboris]MXV52521.1 hypothetical protein [Hufsiella arboris]